MASPIARRNSRTSFSIPEGSPTSALSLASSRTSLSSDHVVGQPDLKALSSILERVCSKVQRLADEITGERAGRCAAIADVEQKLDAVWAGFCAKLDGSIHRRDDAENSPVSSSSTTATNSVTADGGATEQRLSDLSNASLTFATQLSDLKAGMGQAFAAVEQKSDAQGHVMEQRLAMLETNMSALRSDHQTLGAAAASQAASGMERSLFETHGAFAAQVEQLQARMEGLAAALAGQAAQLQNNTDNVAALLGAQLAELREAQARTDDGVRALVQSLRSECHTRTESVAASFGAQLAEFKESYARSDDGMRSFMQSMRSECFSKDEGEMWLQQYKHLVTESVRSTDARCANTELRFAAVAGAEERLSASVVNVEEKLSASVAGMEERMCASVARQISESRASVEENLLAAVQLAKKSVRSVVAEDLSREQTGRGKALLKLEEDLSSAFATQLAEVRVMVDDNKLALARTVQDASSEHECHTEALVGLEQRLSQVETLVGAHMAASIPEQR